MTRHDSHTLPLFESVGVFMQEPKKLRPYQARAIQAARERYKSGKRKLLLVAPTGAGKTTIIAAIIQTSSVPVLFIAHQRELIDQCVEDLRMAGVTNVGVIRGDDERVNTQATIQVASLQTLLRRKDNLPPAGIVIIDEAHRAMGDGYQELLAHYSDALLLGFTATPLRSDGRVMGNSFDHLEVVVTYEKLIEEGHIVAPLCYGSPVVDLSTVPISNGDYAEDPLGDVMRGTNLIGRLVDHWVKLANKHRKDAKDTSFYEGRYRRTLIFAVNIQHSIDICDRFSRAGFRIAHLDGKTPDGQRKKMLRALGDGDIDLISNVGVLLEGVDIPSVKCIGHMRPTTSLTVWRQSCGRELRPWHFGCKRGCLIHSSVEPLLLDHAGNIARHGFPHEDLHWELHEKPQRLSKRISTRICPGCFAYLPAYKRLCPYCGHDEPPAPPSELPRETEEKLQAMASTPEEMKRYFFMSVAAVAKSKGYKPGVASVRYKERYGDWPPRPWTQELKMKFDQDAAWKQALADNQARKAKREAEKAARQLAKTDPEEDG